MARTYTNEQIQAFEEHHGAGMVVVFTVGEDEYAFRRLSVLDVDLALAAKTEQKVNFHEEAAIRCVLTADAPHAGKSGEDSKLDKDALAALVAERTRLALEWKDAAMMRDMIGQGLAQACGWHWSAKLSTLGGGQHQITATLATDYQEMYGLDAPPVVIEARGWTDREYDEYRSLTALGADGEAERYAFGRLITSANKTEVERLYPYLPIALGKYLQALGVTKAVRLKKSRSGQAPQPGNTTSTGGAAISP